MEREVLRGPSRHQPSGLEIPRMGWPGEQMTMMDSISPWIEARGMAHGMISACWLHWGVDKIGPVNNDRPNSG